MNPERTTALILRSSFAAGLLAIVFLMPAQVHSATSPQSILVELFTSEGCSSCPPADRLLLELDRNQPVAAARVIVLSEHVDYWNSLGWRDPFSSAQWSQRQADYARRFDLNSAYTPQMVIDGSRQAVGSESAAVRQAIQKAAESEHLSIQISNLSRKQDQAFVTYSADSTPNAMLYAVIADEFDKSSVSRGENAGRSLDHVAVARRLTEVASLQIAAVGKTLKIDIPRDDANRPLRLILFAQNPKTGAIVGVAEREL